MKKLIGLMIAICLVALPCVTLYSADSSTTTTVTANVTPIFAIELSTGAAVNFTDVDAGQSFVLPDGRTSGDGQNDAEVICRTNLGQQWCLKGSATALSAGLTADNLLIYVPSNAYNRNEAAGSNAISGGMSFSERWYNIWTSPTKVYQDYNTTGNYNTTPNGTLLTFSFALSPSGQVAMDNGTPLVPGDDYSLGGGNTLGSGSYSATITYTMTTTLT